MQGIPGKFGTTMRKDGTRQLTYDGAPLYTFIKDKDSGDMYGQGVVAGGGYWWAVVVARGTSTSPSESTGSSESSHASGTGGSSGSGGW
jgi:hypothetical protein